MDYRGNNPFTRRSVLKLIGRKMIKLKPTSERVELIGKTRLLESRKKRDGCGWIVAAFDGHEFGQASMVR